MAILFSKSRRGILQTTEGGNGCACIKRRLIADVRLEFHSSNRTETCFGEGRSQGFGVLAVVASIEAYFSPCTSRVRTKKKKICRRFLIGKSN